MNKTIIAMLLLASLASPAAAAKFEMGPAENGPLVQVPITDNKPQLGQKASADKIEIDERLNTASPRELCEQLGGTWKRRGTRGWPDPHCER